MSYSEKYFELYRDEMGRRGLSGLEIDEVPKDLDKEIHAAIIEQIGEKPEDEDEDDSPVNPFK